MLKSHSYVATNYAMFQEHVSRHGMRIVDAERDKVGLPLFKVRALRPFTVHALREDATPLRAAVQRLFKLRTSGTAAAPMKAAGEKGTQGGAEPLSRSQVRRRARKGARSIAATGDGAIQGPSDDVGRPDDDFVESETLQEEAEGEVPPLLQVRIGSLSPH